MYDKTSPRMITMSEEDFEKNYVPKSKTKEVLEEVEFERPLFFPNKKTFEEQFDELEVENYGKWRIDRNVAKQFFQDYLKKEKEKRDKEIDEVLEDIEKQRIPPNTLVAVTIWNRCIDKAKQIINKRFK